MPDPNNMKELTQEELQKLQDEFKDQDLASRDESIKLEDIMILRGKGAKMRHPKEITFDDDEGEQT